VLDAEHDPAAEPQDVEVDEGHRPGKGGDLVRDPVLNALRPSYGVLDKDRVRLEQLDVSYPLENNRLFRGHTVPLS
jgi:hypothetical protein